MNFAVERYVRMYRPTADHRLLPWQAQIIWPRVLLAADGSGLIATERGIPGIHSAIGIQELPMAIVEAGVPPLLEARSLLVCTDGYFIRNYVEAQSAKMTDNYRKARQRERDRAQRYAMDAGLFPSVSHGQSQSVTDSHSEPSRAEPILSNSGDPVSIPTNQEISYTGGRDGISEAESAAVARILTKLGDWTGCVYRLAKAHTKLIVRQLRDGVTEREMRGVAAYCWLHLGWRDKPEMHRYLRPETLYGPEAIHKYLPGARAWLAEHFPEEQA